MAVPTLQLHKVSKRFPGVIALDGVDFALRPGEIHALMGENGAGKSTLLKIITGVYQADDGRLELDGRVVHSKSPRESQDHGIAIIHQELNQVPELCIYENFFLGRELVGPLGLLDIKSMCEKTRLALEEVGLSIKPQARLRGLRVAERQLIEIAKAVGTNAKVLLMDEPTTALSTAEARHLFTLIRRLRDKGVAIVYISHRMDEIFEIADRITVLRDGRLVDSRPVGDYTRDLLVTQMVGRPLPNLFPVRNEVMGGEVLRVQQLSTQARLGKQRLQDINIHVRAGEIVGLAGLLGAGRTELLEAIFGLIPLNSMRGDIFIAGERKEIGSPREAIRQGIGFVAEDRKGQSLVLVRSVEENITLSNLRKFSALGKLNLFRERKASSEVIGQLQVKTPSPTTLVGALSGGNQQKVVFARNLMGKPQIFLLDEPTQGVDVGAKSEIYTLIRDLAAGGAGVLLASSDMPELLGLCDRIVVLCEGEVRGELSRTEATQERILDFATRYFKKHNEQQHG